MFDLVVQSTAGVLETTQIVKECDFGPDAEFSADTSSAWRIRCRRIFLPGFHRKVLTAVLFASSAACKRTATAPTPTPPPAAPWATVERSEMAAFWKCTLSS